MIARVPGAPEGSEALDSRQIRPILLIDDDAVQLRVRQAVLHDAGFEVAGAISAEAALALLRAEEGARVAAVVTDHMLPGLSGADVVREIRKVRPGIPVVVVTGLPGAEAEYAGLDIQFRQKPCPPEELIALVRSVTQRTD